MAPHGGMNPPLRDVFFLFFEYIHEDQIYRADLKIHPYVQIIRINPS